MSKIHCLKNYTDALDKEAVKLPDFVTLSNMRFDEYPANILKRSGFVKNVENILEYFEAKNIRIDRWHEYCVRIDFELFKSRYFRPGRVLESENISIDKDLEGTIGVGFDEEPDYEDSDKPELLIWFQNRDFVTDLYLFKPTNWRDVINEFFDMSKAENYESHQLKLSSIKY